MTGAHYNVLNGWHRRIGDKVVKCEPPFGSYGEAVAFALDRLKGDDAWTSQITDARAALEWAVAASQD